MQLWQRSTQACMLHVICQEQRSSVLQTHKQEQDKHSKLLRTQRHLDHRNNHRLPFVQLNQRCFQISNYHQHQSVSSQLAQFRS